MKIGILQTGRAPDTLRARHGDYDEMFVRLLGGNGFDFATWPVLDGVLPPTACEADGWLVTGSRFAVYEDHDWIPPLEALLRDAYEQAVPVVGICFGHQVLAQALGGRVEKFAGGWSVGLERYTLEGSTASVMAWHQDQVIEPPAGAVTIGSSPGCRHAVLAYGERALTVQPHPEFTAAFFEDLLVARGAVLGEEVVARARSGLSGALSSPAIAAMIAGFYRRDRAAR